MTTSRTEPGQEATCTVDKTYDPDLSGIEVRERTACLSDHGVDQSFEGRVSRVR